ncbi:Ig-like domain-containing protein [Mycolicibacterium thermoresistibile]
MAFIQSLPVDDAVKYHLEGALWSVRRTLFNLAPTVAPVQISGKLDGPIVGQIGAVDPEGDQLIYRLIVGPTTGSVQLSADGTYTYTPGEGFDGVDTFRVVAIDAGLHVNLLDPLRPWGTRANNLINQRAIEFEFLFTTGAEHWTAERREALQRAADDLVLYLLVDAPVLLVYDVTGLDDPESWVLASAGSSTISEAPGFWQTVVQNKLLTGVDANGAAADGRITWNFGAPWALGDTVGTDEYDVASTAIHELLHSFGFLSYTETPGANTDRYWTVYDSFLVTADGVRPFNRRYEWDPSYDRSLTGADGGLYFGGAHAVAAYGGLVPLYTPAPWQQGSSISHLDDDTFTGANQMLMNAATDTGPGIRVLSAVEIAILRDLGYQVTPPPPSYMLALVGFVFLGRRRTSAALNPPAHRAGFR